MSEPRRATSPRAWIVVLALAPLVWFGASDRAGSWNDGSRLAGVESLLERGTWRIDDSIFVVRSDPESSPYLPEKPWLAKHGTRDKLFIDGHYYSDKSPIPTLLMVGVYRCVMLVTGDTPSSHPHRFCKTLAFLWSGLSYLVAIFCLFRLGETLRVEPRVVFLVAASFSLTTVAPAYSRYVNNHIAMLAVTMAILWRVVVLVERGGSQRVSLVGLGLLAGLGYGIDLVVGPLLLAAVLAFVALTRSWRSPVLVLAGAGPWLVLHHSINFAIAGTLLPANSVVEYLAWPSSPFTEELMTGRWNHAGVGAYLFYLGDLLFGKQGFAFHNLTTLMTFGGAIIVLRSRTRERPAVVVFALWILAVLAVYSMFSTNRAGVGCSVRWFVPLLAPSSFLLLVLLREFPRYERLFLVLSGWGLGMGLLLARGGTWMEGLVPGYWTWIVLGSIHALWVTPWRDWLVDVGLMFPTTTSPSGGRASGLISSALRGSSRPPVSPTLSSPPE